MQITYLGWASFAIETADGTRIITDPYFGGEGMLAPIPEAHDVLSRYEHVDVIAVSHNAADHVGEAFELAKRFGSLLCCGPDVRVSAMRNGIAKEQIGLLISAVEITHKGVRIKAVEARHISFRELEDGQFLTGIPLGFMITDLADNLTAYFPGDTSVFGDMALFARLYRPTIAMLGIGGVLLEGRLLTEMSPREAAVAASLLGVKYVMPMHYITETGAAEEFARELASEAPQCTLLPLKPGQRVTLTATTIEQIG